MHLEQSNRHTSLPKAGEWVLELLLSDEEREALLGDFHEEHQRLAATEGSRAARKWFWLQVLRSLPAMLVLYSKRNWTRRKIMEQLSFSRRNNQLALLGLMLMLPALILVASGLLQSLFGLTQAANAVDAVLINGKSRLLNLLIHPAVIMGGMALAFVLNLSQVVRVHLKREANSLVSTITVQGKPLNLASVALITLLVSTIFVYLVAENFGVFVRLREILGL